MTNEELWEGALGELEVDLSKANFTSWFNNTFIISKSSDGVVVLGAKNGFTKEWLSQKYHENILKALRRISDDDITTVEYRVASKDSIVQQEEAEPEKVEEKTTEAPAVNDNNTVVVDIDDSSSVYDSGIGFNPRYTFEHFVVGKKNELAHAACQAVAERPGLVYNPLFIYGGVGLGKTHLMQAVGNEVLKTMTNKSILYVTCETFTNEFIKAVEKGEANTFKDKYRSVDILMVDDIQFLAGKEATQEAFFHTFNHLHQRNKQIIITSDRPPRAIPTLEDRLVSRFEGGMIVDVSTPDLETRMAIIKQKLIEKNYDLSQEITQYIASNVQNNVRELEGALNRVIAHHQLQKATPTMDSVKELLSAFSQTSKRGAVTTKKILETVCEYYEVDKKALQGNSRKKELVVPRQIAMYLMREEVHASYPNIGQELGGRDHTTAMHACQKIKKLIEDDERIENDINLIKQRIYNS